MSLQRPRFPVFLLTGGHTGFQAAVQMLLTNGQAGV